MVEFTKMHGLGNDYIYINQISKKNTIRNVPAFTRYICNRHFGVGADGVILIGNSNLADVKMRIYNSDGTQAQMCGNGIRCLGKYIYENGIIHKNEINVETLAGIRKLKLNIENEIVNEVTVDMGYAKIRNKNPIRIKAIDCDLEGMSISIGNPHFVVLTEDVEKVDVKKYGSFLERYKLFSEGTNVEFIEVLGNTSIKMRVWERGVGETLACGTGACAAFAACYNMNLVKSEAKVSLLGGDLNICLDEKTGIIYMTGLATKICDGWINDITS